MTFSANGVIDTFLTQKGVHESFSNGHWDNGQRYSDEVPGLEWSQHQAWCATIVSWVFQTAGAPKGSYPVTASVAVARDFWKKKGRFSEYPALGAQVIFGVLGNAHTGIVISYDANNIMVISGNTNTNGSAEGDGVYIKNYARRSEYVYGYGYPEYPEGITSADPKWAKLNSPPPNVYPAPAPVVVVPMFPGTDYFHVGSRNDYVLDVDRQLIRLGYTKYNDGDGYQPGRYYSVYTRDNVAEFQRSQGWTGDGADGFVGPKTWALLHTL